MSEQTPHRVGEWPVPNPVDLPEPEPEHESPAAVRARFHMVMQSIKHDLEQQPSERAVRAAARRWTDAITTAADEVAGQHRKRG